MIGGIARLASAAGHALIGVSRPGDALVVVVGVTGPARQRPSVTNGRRRAFDAAGVIVGIACATLAVHAFVESPRTSGALGVTAHRRATPAREAATIANGGRRGLVTPGATIGIAGATEALDALIAHAGPIGALRVGLACTADSAVRIANWGPTLLDASRMTGRIANLAVTADTFVAGSRSLVAIGIVAADSAEVA